MKILLCGVNAKYIHTNAAIRLLKAYAEREPVVTADIETAEYTINNPLREIVEGIYRSHPDVIMFSCYIWNISVIENILSDLAVIMPGVHVWLGGPEVSFDPENILAKHENVKGVMIGEGEITFKDLAEYYSLYGKDTRIDPDKIPGICFRKAGSFGESEQAFIRTSDRQLIDMDDVPFIYNSGNIHEFDNKIIYYETSRGCPFGCSYCLSSVEKKVRLRSLEKVYGELQFFLDNRVKQVKFVDRTFNMDIRHSKGILKYILEHDNGVTNFHFEIGGDLLTEEEIGLMSGMRPGLLQLEIGVQSVNPRTITAIHRQMNLKKLKDNVLAIKSFHNIHQHLDLIAGLPYEDAASFAKSFDEVYALQPEKLQLGFLKILKGAPVSLETGSYGIRHISRPPYEVMETRWMTFDDLCRLKRVEEMVDIYYNSGQFTETLKEFEKEFDSPFKMYEKIAEYYEINGLFINFPARIYRYRILLELASYIAPEKAPLYRELLTFDLYLRENMKSRPDFSPDLSPYRDQIRNLQPDREHHVEIFSFDLFKENEGADLKQSGARVAVIFDYQNRDPLNGNAHYSVIRM